jgi:hypothetical protein
VKEALLVEQPDVYFTTPHFDGYRAVLVRLEQISVEDLEELIVEAWLDRAPKRLATEYLAAETVTTRRKTCHAVPYTTSHRPPPPPQ